jgi:hypothetical protein
MKREPLGNEREQNSWLGIMRRGSPAAPTEACLDAETLAAWADGGLSVKELAAVELHASSCARCMAVLATMARTAPAASATHAWTPARVFRWLVPLTAAATAVAIWVAVPDRAITPVQPAPAHDMSASSEPGTPNLERATPNLEPGTRNPEPATGSSFRVSPEPRTGNPALGTRNLEPRAELRADAPSVRQEELQLRDEFRRERVAPSEAQDAAAAAPAAAAPEAAAPPAAAPPTAAAPTAAAEPQSPFASEIQIETLTETTQSVARRIAVSTDSISPSNPQVRWRIVDAMFVERSTNGGKTWTRTASVPGTPTNKAPAVGIVAIRAVDANRAVVGTSDGAQFYTTNAGRSWTRVQENSVAPF